MKKAKIILLSIALVLVSALSLVIVGCGGPSGPSLKLTTKFKLEYYVGEQLDVTNGYLTYTDEEGKEIEVLVVDDMVTGFNSETAGKRKLLITYKDISISVNYTIKNYIDVKTDELYYANPSVISGGSATHYDYFYLDSADEKIYFQTSNVAPETTLENKDIYLKGEDVAYTFTKQIVNGKVVYSITTATLQLTITAKDADTVTVSTIVPTTLNFDMSIYKA